MTILCGKLDVNKSLGCSLEMCPADDVVSETSMVKLTDIMIETSTFTASRGGIAENNGPCFFVLYSLAHNLDRIFLHVGYTDLSVSPK